VFIGAWRKPRALVLLGAVAVLVVVLVKAEHDRLDPSPAGGRTSIVAERQVTALPRYLENKSGEGSRMTPDGWTWYCGVRYLGNSAIAPHFDAYIWEACEEFRAMRGKLATQTAWSVPAVVSFARIEGRYRPIGERQPGDGNRYGSDIDKMFPNSAQDAIDELTTGHGHGSGTLGAMFDELRRRARVELLGRTR
jgi:hypothetical protein